MGRNADHTAHPGKIEHHEADHHPLSLPEFKFKDEVYQKQNDQEDYHGDDLDRVDQRAVKPGCRKQKVSKWKHHQEKWDANPVAW